MEECKYTTIEDEETLQKHYEQAHRLKERVKASLTERGSEYLIENQ